MRWLLITESHYSTRAVPVVLLSLPGDGPSGPPAEGEVEAPPAGSKVKNVLLKQAAPAPPPLGLPPSLASVLSRDALWRFFRASCILTPSTFQTSTT